MLFSSRVRVRVRIEFTGWLVIYATLHCHNKTLSDWAELSWELLSAVFSTVVSSPTDRPSMTMIMSASSICSLPASANLLVAFISFGWTYTPHHITKNHTHRYEQMHRWSLRHTSHKPEVASKLCILMKEVCWQTSWNWLSSFQPKQWTKTHTYKIHFSLQSTCVSLWRVVISSTCVSWTTKLLEHIKMTFTSVHCAFAVNTTFYWSPARRVLRPLWCLPPQSCCTFHCCWR